MNQSMYRRVISLVILFALLCLGAALTSCSTPEGGSSMPWSQPEQWEQGPKIGVPM